MEVPPSPEPIPQFRELRKPYFLYRTPDALGSYLQREVSRALFSRKELLTRFLVPAQLSGLQVRPPRIEYDFEGRNLNDFTRMRYVSRTEIAAFKAAVEEFLRKAEPGAIERITPHERELRQHFRLPDPVEEPDAYWLFGPPNDRKLVILWGCEFRQNTSLPLVPQRDGAPGASVLERLEACATPWEGLQAEAIELIRRGKEPLLEFLATPNYDPNGKLRNVLVEGKSVSAEVIKAPKYFPKLELQRLRKAAEIFYAKAHADVSGVSSYEKEIRAALRFPDPDLTPAAYVMAKAGTGRRLLVLMDGKEKYDDTAPVVGDDELSTKTGSAVVSSPVVDKLMKRASPTRGLALAGAALVVLAGLAAWLGGVFTPRTPPRLLDASAENTPTQVVARFSENLDPATLYSAEEKAARQHPTFVEPRRNFQLDDADGTHIEIKAIQETAVDPTRVVLTTGRLDDSKDYTLIVQNVADRHGNVMKDREQTRVTYIDTLPPKLVGDPSADGADSRRIILKFNEPLDERYSTMPANFSVPGFVFTQVQLERDDPTSLVLTANNPFKAGERYTLTITGVTDRARRPNSIREAVVKEFPYIDRIPPTVQEVVADKSQVEMQVVFSEPVQKGEAETPGNYVVECKGLPTVTAQSARLLDDLRSVQLRTPPLLNGKDYTLKILNIRDRATPPNSISSKTKVKFAYTGRPDFDAPVIAAVSVRGDGLRVTVIFNKALDSSTAVDATHYRLSDPAIKIVQVVIKRNDPKAIILTLDQALQETKNYRLTVSGVADTIGNVLKEQTSKAFAGPGLSISQADVLGISTVETSKDGSSITISFTDEIDRASASKKGAFVVTDGPAIKDLQFDEQNYRQVRLVFAAPLEPLRYTLVVKGVGLRSEPSKIQREIRQGFGGPGARGL